ncbi:GrpB family protein [Paraliobacillus salinarum]|uniref:GrpB family protein n=1 Tax=Paraliobacillus salinarum TaxID=1158996 RepID=UPI0015F51A04|nr:GrpB family protein [Paraliobacillus salinarum]
MLGLPSGEVFLMPWTKEWSKEFLLEKESIQNKIGKSVVNIHHIGSTAVKGLSAKPIIDIAIEIKEFDDGECCAHHLECLGYTYKGINILPDRHYFIKGEPRTHQIHMYQAGNKYLLEQLSFRDYLRSNDSTRIEYQKLKIELSEMNKQNKHKYAEQKTNFVQSVLART